jgi:asparagine synthase (glutamine-hydrolysing)
VKVTLAILDKSGGNAASAVARVLAQISEPKSQFQLATPAKLLTTDNAEELARQENSAVAVGSASNAPQQNKTLMHLTQDAAVAFGGQIYAPVPEPSEAEFVAARIKGNYEKAAEALVGEGEGDFSLLTAQAGRLTAARDPVGVQPLYFGETKQVAALASNRRALWELGIAEPKSFPPGNTAVATAEGFKFTVVKTLAYAQPKPITMQEAAKQLQKLLEQAVQRRVFGQKKVAVAFSGGLDSSVVACLTKRCGVEVELVHVSLDGQPETGEARRAAEALDLPMREYLFTEADVEMVVPKVVELVEESDPVKAAVGVPFYWNAQKAAELGCRVMLAGQGADELFGGYQRYVNQYLSEGDEAVRQTMFHDVAVIHESNVERDEKICGFHDVELRIPFGSFAVAEFAMSLPTELKFECMADSLRKLVLRKTAENLGLPKSIAEKPKKAVQYSTGINSALRKLAKKQNLTLKEYVERLFLKAKTGKQ